MLELNNRGDISIILITHNHAQVFEICYRIVFLSCGKILYDTCTADTTVANLIDLMGSGQRLNDSATPDDEVSVSR